MRAVAVIMAVGLVGSALAQAARAADGAKAAEPPVSLSRMLEGFESLSALQGRQGELVSVTEGQGVTQGNAALQIPPQGAVTISLTQRDLTRPWWLKLDTYNVQPESQMLRLEFSGGLGAQIHAVVQPGKDTLSMPLSMPSIVAGREWDDDGRLTIRNVSESPIIVDNLRMEPPADWPKDARAYDLGSRFGWPGFSAETDWDTSLWRWDRTNNNTLNFGYPHPLVNSTMGPWPGDRTVTNLQLKGGTKGATVGFLWLSHVSTNNMQPVEYSARLNGKFLVNKKHQPRAMVSTDGKRGLMVGMNGEWTPAWFNKTYAPTFYDVVPIVLTSGNNELELINMQVSAVVVAPGSEKAALAKAVEQVEKDLSTYRRQFVAGRRVEPTCTFAATEEESKSGLILLPADDTSFSPTWQPTDETRLTKLEATAFAGATVVLPLAVIPLKKAPLAATPGAFRSAEGGKPLTLSKPAEMEFAARLPRIADASVYMQPWVLRSRVSSTKEREVILAAVVLPIAPTAAEGTYNGQIKLALANGSCTLPVEVTVRNVGMPSPMPTFGVSAGSSARDAYGPVAAAVDKKEQDRLSSLVRQELLKAGFNAFAIPASGLNWDRDMTPNDDACVQALRTLGKAPGVFIGDLGSARNVLSNRFSVGMNQNYIRGIGGAIGRTHDLARKAGVPGGILFNAGTIWNDRGMDDVLEAGEHIQSAKGRSIAFVPGYVLQPRNDRDIARFRDSFSAIVVGAGNPVYSKIEAFAQPGAGQSASRDVFFEFYVPDVYMMGFYAFGMGVQGWYCAGLHMRPGPYSGWGFGSPGYLVPEPEMGQLSPTVAMLRARQGQNDFLLARRADEVLELAKKHNVDAAELSNLLTAIRDKARGLQGIGPDRLHMRTTVMSPKELDDLRRQLIAATADVAKNLPKK